MSIPFGFSPNPGDDNNGMADMFENLARMMRSGASDSAVNWESARSASIDALKTSGDSSPSREDHSASSSASDLADLWLNDATIFPSNGQACDAISRGQWLATTFDSWKEIVEPVADGVASAMTSIMPDEIPTGPMDIPEELLASLPPEMAEQMRAVLGSADFGAMASQMMSMAKSMGATMFGMQFGQALGEMAAEVLSTSDIGIPLMSAAKPALVSENVSAFTNGLAVEANDVRIYIALRELAHMRLFTCAPWLQSQVYAAIGEYARGVKIDTARIEEVMRDVDPQNPDSLNELLGGNMFEATQTDEQRNALDRLEVLLALIEGWVTVVVTQAIGNRLPASTGLEEMFRRRRAAGGPAEKLFAGLVGLEIHPRRIREAVVLWTRIGETSGMQERDNLWSHPDLLPRGEDLENADGFVIQESYDIMAELNKAMESGSIEDPEDR